MAKKVEVKSDAERWLQRLHAGLSEQGFHLTTPAGNRSAIVSFEHESDVEMVRTALEAANIQVSLREGGTQIRAGAALFNNAGDIDRLLDVTGQWV